MILLGLRAQPHLVLGLSPHQHPFGTELTLPADFASKEAEELDRPDFYKQLQKAKFVRKDGHKLSLAEAFRHLIGASIV